MKKLTLSLGLFAILSVVVTGVIFLIPKERKIDLDLLVADKDIDTLAKDSAAIIVGQVENILSSKETINRHTGDTIVFTDYVLLVSETLKGDNNGRVILRLPGGTVKDGKEKLTVIASDAPGFVIGEKVLVFLSKSTDGFFDLPDEHYTIDGWFQGKYQIINSEAKNPKGSLAITDLKSKIKSVTQVQK